ncbi:unnamed protein product, partial [Meganyctiphanes norvegica]
MKIIGKLSQGRTLICLFCFFVLFPKSGTMTSFPINLIPKQMNIFFRKPIKLNESWSFPFLRFSSFTLQNMLYFPKLTFEVNLLRYVRNHILFPPSTLPYNLSNPHVKDPSAGQTKRALEILNNMEFGYFVEAGGLTGERLSNSIYMERFLGWTGLIVEPDPINFKELLTKNRKAWLANVCLSLQPYPVKITLSNSLLSFLLPPISSNRKKTNSTSQAAVVCFLPSLPSVCPCMVKNALTDYQSLEI